MNQSWFYRCLLLTRVVRDVRGQAGQERYLGLYYAPLLPSCLKPVRGSPELTPSDLAPTPTGRCADCGTTLE